MASPPLNEGLLTSWLGDLFEYETGRKKSKELKKWYDYTNKLIAERKFEQLEMYTMNLIMGIDK